MSLLDLLDGKGAVTELAVEGELVGGVAIRDLQDYVTYKVIPEGKECADLIVAEESENAIGEVLGKIAVTVVLASIGVVDVNHDDLPVSLAFINHGIGTEDLNLNHITSLVGLATNLANINGVVVTEEASILILVHGVLPSYTFNEHQVQK